MQKRIFNSWRELTKLNYFKLLPDGRLKLIVEEINGIIDFHTHLGLTFFISPPVDLTKRTLQVEHNFGSNLKVNLDIYSGQNLFEERPKWVLQDWAMCALLPFKKGKHLTHTIPNIVWEMDALKISQSVCLSIDLANVSDNSLRIGKALKDNQRVIFYCSVHPKDKIAEKKIKKFLKLGARGIKIHPEVQLVAADSKIMLKFLQKWKKLSGGLPVLFHSGYNGFEPKWASKYSAIDLYYPAAETLADTPCILGHAAMNEYQTAIKIAQKFKNVYLEISGQPPEHLKEMLDKLGDDRLLFGSDWPIYPQAIPLAKVLIATENLLQTRIKILRDNALKLLNNTLSIPNS